MMSRVLTFTLYYWCMQKEESLKKVDVNSKIALSLCSPLFCSPFEIKAVPQVCLANVRSYHFYVTGESSMRRAIGAPLYRFIH